MAIFNSVLVGGARNSVDNITMYESGGQRIARRKPMKVKNPRTEKQLRQRAKMKFLSELSVGFLEVAAVGFARRDARLSAANAFVQANMGNVTVDEDFVATMDYGLLACSADKKLKRPLVTATLSGSSLTFNLTAQEAWGSAKKDDQVYGVLFRGICLGGFGHTGRGNVASCRFACRMGGGECACLCFRFFCQRQTDVGDDGVGNRDGINSIAC